MSPHLDIVHPLLPLKESKDGQKCGVAEMHPAIGAAALAMPTTPTITTWNYPISHQDISM
jgi:hypothetical protein